MSAHPGLWCKVYRDGWEHDKVLLCARRIVEAWDTLDHGPERSALDCEVLESLAPDLAFSGLLRLNMHLLDARSPDGSFRLKRGDETRFLQIVWPSAPAELFVAAPEVLAAYIEAGLVHAGPGTEWHHHLRLHQYEEHNAGILRKRDTYVAFKKDRQQRSKTRARPEPGPTPVPDPAPDPDRTRRRTRTGPAPSPAPDPAPIESERVRELESASSPAVEEALSPTQGSDPVPLAAIAAAWRETATVHQVPWIKHPHVPKGEPETAVRARWRELPDMTLWQAAMRAAALDDFWGGRKLTSEGKRWRAEIGSFARDKHFQKWVSIAQESDWRLADDQDLAWSLWWGTLSGLGKCPPEIPYTGEWPGDGKLTPMQADMAEVALRLWWVKNLYRGGES